MSLKSLSVDLLILTSKLFRSFVSLDSHQEERLPSKYMDSEFEMNGTMMMMMIKPTNVSGK